MKFDKIAINNKNNIKTSDTKKDSPTGFIQHLEELRRRIIFCILIILVASAVSYNFVDKLIYYLSKPIGRLVFIQPAEAFLAYIKLAIFCGLFISFPFILYQVWVFISPGLKPLERRYVLSFLPLGILLFFLGCMFGYFVMIPFGIKFLIAYGRPWLAPMISIGSYISFFCIMILIFGFVFELPVVILFLSKIGITNPKALRRNRRYIVLIIFIIAAILTPPDVFSQIAMAIPLLVLYELSIFISYLGRKK